MPESVKITRVNFKKVVKIGNVCLYHGEDSRPGLGRVREAFATPSCLAIIFL